LVKVIYDGTLAKGNTQMGSDIKISTVQDEAQRMRER